VLFTHALPFLISVSYNGQPLDVAVSDEKTYLASLPGTRTPRGSCRK
jgi:hypothetical protein